MNTEKVYEIDWRGTKFSIRTGKIAKQAGGAVIVKHGDTEVLVTACHSASREGTDFFPLTVEYREAYYAAGKIPGGFIKREARPSTKEILTCRMIDRPIRPLFPEGYCDEIQVAGHVMSFDKTNDPDIATMIGASAALSISSMPFMGPTGSCRVGYINEEYVINPTIDQMKDSKIDLIVSATKENVCMVEAGADEVSETIMLDGILAGHEAIKEVIELQEKMVAEVGKEKDSYEPPAENPYKSKILAAFGDRINPTNITAGKKNREKAIDALKEEIIESLSAGIAEDELENTKNEISAAFKEVLRADTRKTIAGGIRLDGRKTDEIRPIEVETRVFSRQHGSAMFQRGETQALVSVTLGSGRDDQIVEGLNGTDSQRYYLHYNFPPYCVGECGRMGGTKRREIGHGNLAERALKPMIPSHEEFPYIIRIVSDITESNGSSSMASVCGGCLALMDAGVPIKDPVAGVAMGLVKEGDDISILSDIQGEEDHEGDMDFKVTGTQHGITAIQMDIKIDGLSREILETSLNQAKEGRLHILREMMKGLDAPREELSEHAPCMFSLKINTDKIGAMIGPGGKIIRAMQEETNSTITVDDDGTVTIVAETQEGGKAAKAKVEALTCNPEIGKIYHGPIKGIKDFGVFVEILPGLEGLCHVSELSNEFVKDINEIVKMGDELDVKLIDIDSMGRLKLSRKAALPAEEKND